MCAPRWLLLSSGPCNLDAASCHAAAAATAAAADTAALVLPLLRLCCCSLSSAAAAAATASAAASLHSWRATLQGIHHRYVKLENLLLLFCSCSFMPVGIAFVVARPAGHPPSRCQAGEPAAVEAGVGAGLPTQALRLWLLQGGCLWNTGFLHGEAMQRSRAATCDCGCPAAGQPPWRLRLPMQLGSVPESAVRRDEAVHSLSTCSDQSVRHRLLCPQDAVAQAQPHTMVGTPAYVAPEVLASLQVGAAQTLWLPNGSILGCVGDAPAPTCRAYAQQLCLHPAEDIC